MRRRRYRKPNIKNVKGYWIAQYRDLGGTKRKVSLGPVKTTRKSDAEERLAKILEPINSRRDEPSPDIKIGTFVRQIYLPFYSRKWKRSTAATNVDRLQHHLLAEFEERSLGSFSRGRDELQDFLDQKAKVGLSYSVVAHLRWDLRQIFRMAVSEQYLERNPAELLFIPREAPRAATRRMTLDDVRQMFAVLGLRERVIGGLAILAGMRPGEIFALTRSRAQSDFANIQQRATGGRLIPQRPLSPAAWRHSETGCWIGFGSGWKCCRIVARTDGCSRRSGAPRRSPRTTAGGGTSSPG